MRGDALQVKPLLRAIKLMLRSSKPIPPERTRHKASHGHEQLPEVISATLPAATPSHRSSSSSHAASPLKQTLYERCAAAADASNCPTADSAETLCTDGASEEDHCCIVCMERTASVTFMPCTHTLTCQPCANACLQRSCECLMCRRKVISLLLV